MAQERMMMNNIVIHQPEKGLKYSTETKYSQDSGRVQSGEAHITPLFTVEQLGYAVAKNLLVFYKNVNKENHLGSRMKRWGGVHNRKTNE